MREPAIYKRFSIVILGFTLSITPRPILTTALQNPGPQRGVNPNQPNKALQPHSRNDQQDQGGKDQGITPNPQPNPLDRPITVQGTVSGINEPTTEQKAEKAAQETKGILDKGRDTAVEQWPSVGLLIVGAVALGFAIGAYRASRRQAKAAEDQVGIMRKQFDATYVPHVLFIGLTAINWEDGKEPVLFASFRNDGLVTSPEVRTTMSIKLGNIDMGHSVANLVIAGKETRQHFQALGRTFSAAFWADINGGGVPFCVRIGFSYKHDDKQESKEYCMEYFAWADPRPRHVPLFVFCTGKCLAKDQPTPEWLKPKVIMTTSSGMTAIDLSSSGGDTSD